MTASDRARALAAALAAGFALLLPSAASAQEDTSAPPAGTDAQEAAPTAIDPATFIVPVDRLATQQTTPFRRVGLVMDPDHPQWGKFRRNVARFSGAEDCLLPGAIENGKADLLQFNWHARWSQRDFEVCLFHVLSSLGSTALMREWLAANGMRVSITLDGDLTESIPGPDVWGFWGYWTLDEAVQRSNIAGGLIGEALARATDARFGISVEYLKDETLFGVDIITFSK